MSSKGARGRNLVLPLAFTALCTLNVTYYLYLVYKGNSYNGAKSSIHITHELGCGSSGNQADHAVLAPQSDQEVLRYLREVVPESSSQPAPLQHYLIEPKAKDKTLHEYRQRVADYLQSKEFEQRWSKLKQQTGNERGIVICAGGEYYLPQAIVLLRVLRHHLNSTLPVELFWHGAQEMDEASLKAIKKEFGPLEGYDMTALPYPRHHRPGAELKGFPMKPYALLQSRFKEVLLLDCDVVLARDPSFMFDSTGFRAKGNYFWGDIYGEGMVKTQAFGYVGLVDKVKEVLDQGKQDFKRYAESGQVLINRAMHLDVLEWTWFLNSFSKGHLYEFMYGDKDTYGLGFALAGKAHMYQHINMPPGGVFTHRDALGWKPKEDQMNKQGNWWLHGLVHYGEDKEVLLLHRVTGELSLGMGAPKDEVITPPIPHAWSMWFMGYAPNTQLLTSLNVLDLNLTYLLASVPPGQACPSLAWSAYWTMRTHAIPTDRRLSLEAACQGMLAAQYGTEGAKVIGDLGLVENPVRLVINSRWEDKVNEEWKPKVPLMAVPLNMTAAYNIWENTDAALRWGTAWAKKNVGVLRDGKGRGLLTKPHAQGYSFTKSE